MAIFFIMVVRSSSFLLFGISIMAVESVDSRLGGDSTTDDSSKKTLLFSDGDAPSGVFKLVMAVEGDRRDKA